MSIPDTRFYNLANGDLPPRPLPQPDLPWVSIITPNYNYGHFLEKCIRSVLGQTYPNIEYHIIDGGSTDSSLEVIKRYADKGISSWTSEPDKGQTDAINKGFARCTGNLFAWLNADDAYTDRGVIQEVVNHYQAGARFISGEFNAFDGDGEPDARRQSYGLCRPVDFLQCLRFWKNICPPQPATFVDRQLADRVFPLDVKVECYMDYQLFLGVLEQAPATRWVAERWVDFIYHGANKSLGNFSVAYDWEDQARRVFLTAAEKLPLPEFEQYKKEFEATVIQRTFSQHTMGKNIRRTVERCPGFLLSPSFWKPAARRLLFPRKPKHASG